MSVSRNRGAGVGLGLVLSELGQLSSRLRRQSALSSPVKVRRRFLRKLGVFFFSGLDLLFGSWSNLGLGRFSYKFLDDILALVKSFRPDTCGRRYSGGDS